MSTLPAAAFSSPYPDPNLCQREQHLVVLHAALLLIGLLVVLMTLPRSYLHAGLPVIGVCELVFGIGVLLTRARHRTLAAWLLLATWLVATIATPTNTSLVNTVLTFLPGAILLAGLTMRPWVVGVVLTTCFAFLLLVLAPAAAQSWRSITLQEIVSYGSMLMMSPTLIVLVGTMANTRAVEAARLTHQQTEPFGNVHTSPAAPPEVRREDNDFQRPILCALRVPVMPVDRETLIVSLHGAFDHRRLNDLQQRTLTAIHQTPVQRLVLDVTGTSVIDSTRAEDLVALVQEAQLLGIEVVLVGLRPKVAQSIVSRGLDLTSLRMFPDLHVALEEVRPFASPAFPQTYRRN